MVTAIVGSGRLLSKEERKERGIRYPIGDRFLAAIGGADVNKAADRLDVILHTATSRALSLHTLRRMEEAGITHCRLSSPGDERATATERKWDEKLITIEQARVLVEDRAEEVRRSAFLAEIPQL
jgi:hypothetical protein